MALPLPEPEAELDSPSNFQSNKESKESPGSLSRADSNSSRMSANRLKLVVNVVFGSGSLSYSKLPNEPKFRNCKVRLLLMQGYVAVITVLKQLLTIVVDNIPPVNPFTMDTMGFKAYE